MIAGTICAKGHRAPSAAGRFVAALARAMLVTALLAPQISRAQAPAAPQEARVDLYGDPLPAGALVRLGSIKPAEGGTERGHSLGIYDLAFSPDGRQLATRGGDLSVRVWEAASGKEIVKLKGGRPVEFTRDGQFLVVGDDKRVNIHSAQDWSLLRSIACKELILAKLAGEGKQLLVLDQGVPIVYDVATGDEVRKLDSLRVIKAYGFSPDGHLLAYARNLSDTLVQVNDVSKGELVRALTGSRDSPKAAAFSADGRLLACGGRDEIRIWELDTGIEVALLQGHEKAVGALAFSPDGRFLASGSWDKTIRLWEVLSGREVAVLDGHTNFVNAVAFSPDGRLLASGSTDRTALVWDVSQAILGKTPAAGPLADEKLKEFFADLTGVDARKAIVAVAALAGDPEHTLPYTRTHVAELFSPTQREKILQWIKDLDSPEFMVRERASEQLLGVRDTAKDLLLKELKTTGSAEVRFRIRRILARPQAATGLPAAEVRRIKRLIHVLELIGTAESKEVLEVLAKDAPSEEINRLAKRALEGRG
ncbi:MAG: WD40 repeat domain-containing protein [Planctomycetia bacterium]|nr:WD40 repeat domain-containing protein [Planctomycetia bacterium]